ncbi:TonB-dependent receptor [candidate division KSB1 bacterium]|nr:TonB-dependent receptor [candidate division KSB1 bacterium]
MGEDRPGSLTIDFYRTEFHNQIVVDLDSDVQAIHVSNLDGCAFSNSGQIEFIVTAAHGLEVTGAYRLNDVKSTSVHRLRELPLNPRHKGLVALSYTCPGRAWRFDVTTQYTGRTRLPDTDANPPEFRLAGISPDYVQIFAQITRKFSALELYAGVENLGNFRQSQPILAWSEPFSPYFDSSQIWGPTVGRRFYLGLRLN